MHWSKRKEIADDFHTMVKWAIRRQKTSPVSSFPIRMRYTFCFAGRALDVLNCSTMAKMIEDGFVREGIVPDDSPKYISEVSIEQKKSPSKADFVHIEWAEGLKDISSK